MWRKTGRFFSLDDCQLKPWRMTHTQVPTPLLLGDRLRVYYGTRDRNQRTCTTFVDVDPDTFDIIHVHGKPVLGLGPVGDFDDCGAMPSCALRDGDMVLLYYVGWNRSFPVPFRLSIGVAISTDGGETFRKHGPILDRSVVDPYWVSLPFVFKEDVYHLWYTSCVGWEFWGGRWEASYQTHHAVSNAGITWTSAWFSIDDENWATARPTVIHRDKYMMWDCSRGLDKFRTDPATSYRIGYAESLDGLAWKRGDSGIVPGPDAWDSTMTCYPSVYEYDGRLHMLYNGDGFGQTGIGHAVEE